MPIHLSAAGKFSTQQKESSDLSNANLKNQHEGITRSALARPVSARPEPRGICVTCIYAKRCLFVTAARQPIQFCDEFDDKARTELI